METSKTPEASKFIPKPLDLSNYDEVQSGLIEGDRAYLPELRAVGFDSKTQKFSTQQVSTNEDGTVSSSRDNLDAKVPTLVKTLPVNIRSESGSPDIFMGAYTSRRYSISENDYRSLEDPMVMADHTRSGGQALVYNGIDHLTGRKVKIKIEKADNSIDKGIIDISNREAIYGADLLHPNLVTPLDQTVIAYRDERDSSKKNPDLKYKRVLILPDAGNQNVNEYLKLQGKKLAATGPSELTIAGRTCLVLSQTAQALDYVNSRGYAHLDVKPTNIVVNDGGPDQKNGIMPKATLVDNGILRKLDNSNLDKWTEYAEQELFSTFNYTSPEVYAAMRAGDYTNSAQHDLSRADQYSLGVIAYGALGGSLSELSVENPNSPHADPYFLSRELPEIPGASPEINAIVKKACARNSADRYDSCSEFVNKLIAQLQLERQKAGAPGDTETVQPVNARTDLTANDVELLKNLHVIEDSRDYIQELRDLVADN